eukprot:1157652-Pelagomonas_calceolata.AAC.1
MNILLAGQDQSQADQLNSLAEGSPDKSKFKSMLQLSCLLGRQVLLQLSCPRRQAGVFNRKSMEITTQEWHTLAFGAIQGRHLALTALSS